MSPPNAAGRVPRQDPATLTVNTQPPRNEPDVASMVSGSADNPQEPRHETRWLPHGLVAVLVLRDPRVRAADDAADAAAHRASLKAGHTVAYAKDRAAAAREDYLNEAGVAS